MNLEAKESQSVNTIYKENGKIIGHNTDIAGFELAIRHLKYDAKNKKIFILGAGGVVPSIIIALKRMGVKTTLIAGPSNLQTEKGLKIIPNFFSL